MPIAETDNNKVKGSITNVNEQIICFWWVDVWQSVHLPLEVSDSLE